MEGRNDAEQAVDSYTPSQLVLLEELDDCKAEGMKDKKKRKRIIEKLKKLKGTSLSSSSAQMAGEAAAPGESAGAGQARRKARRTEAQMADEVDATQRQQQSQSNGSRAFSTPLAPDPGPVPTPPEPEQQWPDSVLELARRMGDPVESFGNIKEPTRAEIAPAMNNFKQYFKTAGIDAPESVQAWKRGPKSTLPEEFTIVSSPSGLTGKLPRYFKIICLRVMTELAVRFMDPVRMFMYPGTRDSRGIKFLVRKEDMPILRSIASTYNHQEGEKFLNKMAVNKPCKATWLHMQTALSQVSMQADPVFKAPVIDVAELSDAQQTACFNVMKGWQAFAEKKKEGLQEDVACEELRKALQEAVKSLSEPALAPGPAPAPALQAGRQLRRRQ